MKKRIFAFDLGKASIGYCVREDNEIKCANSIILDKDYGEIASQRDRRRIKKTLDAHKAREEFFNNLWIKAGLEILTKDDERFKKEFPSKNENEIYTSCLLRIALLQNKTLKHWQIYKALYNAIQRRGYDPNVKWANNSDDDKKNIELLEKYTKENDTDIIQNEIYKYPCYYDALRLGLWDEKMPEEFKRAIPIENNTKVRSTDYVAPRNLIIKELSRLWENAKKQIPQLSKITTEEFLWGDYREQYGSLVNPDLRKFMGRKEDWTGVLGQKIPRFENRIISKCKLLPKRNVCKADTFENATFCMLMKLKNLRFTNIYGEKCKLNFEDINLIYNNWLEKIKSKEGKLDTTITKPEIEKLLGIKILDKIEPMKINISGRSSFCRRACEIMKKIILSGQNPLDIDVSEFIDNPNTQNPITKQEIEQMLLKAGTWENLYVSDNRDENSQDFTDLRIKTDIILSNVTNSIVKNRLQLFRDLIFKLVKEYGVADDVIFEFVRQDSLEGKKRAKSYEDMIKKNEKDNEVIKKELESVNAKNKENFLKLKLLKMQGGKCIYSGKPIEITNFDACEIDHIFPRTYGGNDELSNKVLCFREYNQQKAGRCPFEWLSKDENIWVDYVDRLNKIKTTLGNKKFELLTSPKEKCIELIGSYNGLAETGHISRLAQQITAVIFGWGLGVKDENRHIFVNNGSSTSKIRRQYHLNSLLGDDEKKNRENDKHHALDAICISYSREYKYNKEKDCDEIKDFPIEQIKKVINEIMPMPYAHKKVQKQTVRPLETIYGKRTYGDKEYITNRTDITRIEMKDSKIKSIIDNAIKNDLLEKMAQNPDKKTWENYLSNYYHPLKKTKVKKVMLIESEGKFEKDSNGRERMGEFVDFGSKGTIHQFKHSKAHKGQILYFDNKNNVKVMPIYANIKTQEVKNKLAEMGYKLYNKGQIFSSGCLVQVSNDFKGGKNTYPKGIYKVRTIMSDGKVKLESNNGIEILTSAKNLAEAKFHKAHVDF
ncbi:MAG: hypothetical protein IJ877_01705 [Candidatus Gastranaerophilales bacterium]|nr:hypothetical protein [Candidatus Gastranaerophilales bacterium]